MVDPAVLGNGIITPLAPFLIVQQDVDCLPFISIGTPQTVLLVDASRIEEGIASGALENCCLDSRSLLKSRGVIAIETINQVGMGTVKEHGHCWERIPALQGFLVLLYHVLA